jgi:radical SAM protein with 4Fe4S-binding SPASM domain
MEYIEGKDNLVYYDLLTNGTLVNEDMAARLTAFPKLRRVQVSLEGHNAEVNDSVRGSGTFGRITQAIRVLKGMDVQVSVMLTLSRRNIEIIPQMVDLLSNLGVDVFSVERFIPEGSGIHLCSDVLSSQELHDAFSLIYRLAMKTQKPRILLYRPLFAQLDPDNETVGAMCSVGTNALTVMQDGTVYPCRRLPIPIGHALRDGFFKIWYDSELLWEIRDARNIKGKCNNCPHFAVCRGCRAMAYFVNQDYLAEDPQCWM